MAAEIHIDTDELAMKMRELVEEQTDRLLEELDYMVRNTITNQVKQEQEQLENSGYESRQRIIQALVDELGIECFREIGKNDVEIHRLMQKHIPTY